MSAKKSLKRSSLKPKISFDIESKAQNIDRFLRADTEPPSIPLFSILVIHWRSSDHHFNSSQLDCAILSFCYCAFLSKFISVYHSSLELAYKLSESFLLSFRILFFCSYIVSFYLSSSLVHFSSPQFFRESFCSFLGGIGLHVLSQIDSHQW